MSEKSSAADTPRSAIVVGAGSSGSVVARRLADAGVEVTVLEAGGEDTNPAIHDLSRMGELWHSVDDWDYYTTPQDGANGHRLHWPRGRVLGGSHALNAMIWVRCTPQDFDHWASLGNDGWAWADVLPVYKDIENYHGAGDPAWHGADGPLDVTDEYALSPIQQSIIDAAVEEGLAHNPDYNGESIEGVSQQQVTIRDGERLNTYMAYLKPVRDRVTVEVGCHVHELIFAAAGGDGGAGGAASGRPRVTGVRFSQDGEIRELFADEVILSAGAIDSPRVLLRSGIGPAAELAELGIDAVVDLPGVGKNLHDHYLAPVIFDTEKPIDPPREGVSVTQSHLFWKSREELDRPDTQPIHFSVPMYGEFLEPRGANGFSLMAGLITPQSRGEIRLSGPDPDAPLLLDPAALSHEDDVASLVASVRQCRRIGSQASLAASPEDGGWGATEVYPGPSVGDGDDLVDYVRNTLATYHHQVGTCKMGVDEAAVVSPRLAVHGVDGLRVIDASVMPRVTTGNTNAPAVLIGELGARFVLAGER
ncbi:GMC family oxidoreductase [Leucobacter luti]|uniref:GMC family oxidoreductase n=1 Tax=Leucobacter luti TaxID=340320 RepID=UPI003CFF913B